MKKVSIIIPVYNVAEYLPRCIESVLNQDGISLEVLLINDGSTDISGEICDEYAKKDDRIKVFHQENRGVSAARNKGIEESKGDWITFVDADDWIEKNSLERILNIIKGNKLIEIAIAKSFVNNGEMIGSERYQFKKEWLKENFDGISLSVINGFNRGSVCGVLFRKEFLIMNNIIFPLNIIHGEDSLFITQCNIFSKYVRFVDIHLYNVYERIGSASRSWTFEKLLKKIDNIIFINNYIDTHKYLSLEAISLLNFAKYRVVSTIFNNIHNVFSFKGYIKIRARIKDELKGKIETGEIKKNKNAVRILNYSIDIFALLTILKSKLFKEKQNR